MSLMVLVVAEMRPVMALPLHCDREVSRAKVCLGTVVIGKYYYFTDLWDQKKYVFFRQRNLKG